MEQQESQVPGSCRDCGSRPGKNLKRANLNQQTMGVFYMEDDAADVTFVKLLAEVSYLQLYLCGCGGILHGLFLLQIVLCGFVHESGRIKMGLVKNRRLIVSMDLIVLQPALCCRTLLWLQLFSCPSPIFFIIIARS